MKKNNNIEAGNLYRKYFIEDKSHFNKIYFDNYLFTTERGFKEALRNQLKQQFHKLCKEYDLIDLHFKILYCYGLSNCIFRPFRNQLNEIDTESKKGHLERINAASILNEFGINPAVKEAKIQFTYMAGGILHYAEITERKTLKDIRNIILQYLISEEKFYNQNPDLQLTREYLNNTKIELSKQKKTPGRPAINKRTKETIIKVLNFIQEETALKKDSKIISEKQALFIYSYLKIFELTEYETEFPEEEAAYIRAILQ